MEKMLNIILIMGLLVLLNFCLQKHKNKKAIPKNNNIVTEKFNMEKIYMPTKVVEQPIKFNYDKPREIDKQFQKEQNYGAGLKTWYPNTWIERIDENGQPVYGSREKETGNLENFIESKARFSYEFNSPRSVQMDGIADPDDFKDGKGRTLKEVYDNSFVDFKKLVPKKEIVGDSSVQTYSQSGASNLSFISPDTWIYENEKAENGGQILKGLYASDPLTMDTVAIFQ
jgi:hypothetical protein